MIKNDFKQRLRDHESLIGMVVTLGMPEITEIMSVIGFDWLWIDLEHTPIDYTRAQSMIQAMNENCASIIRVPSNDEVCIKKVLDLGCDGVIIPQIKTFEDAQKAIKSCKYPPDGTRSVGISRAHSYGYEFSDYVQTANKNITIILQIEHIDGVENLQEILKVEGVDAILVGPYDLSGSMNKLGSVADVSVQKKIREVQSLCKNNNIPAGIFVADPESAKKSINDGFSLIGVGLDMMFLWKGAKDVLSYLR